MEGGGTIPWIGFVAPGLTDFDEPSWGGWSGRFGAERLDNVWSRHADVKTDEQRYVPFSVYTEAADTWTDQDLGHTYHDRDAPVWRWRQAMWNDLQARMDWCVQPYSMANHRPVAVLNGDSSDAILKFTRQPGEVVELDASGSSDPDGDAVGCSWWNYPESGQRPYGQTMAIENPTADKIQFQIPQAAAGKEIHVILEVTDQSKIVPLVDYRRVVVSVAGE